MTTFLTKFLALINQYPWLWTLIIVPVGWYLLSGAVLSIFNRWIPTTDEQWALLFHRQPKLAALAKFSKAWGWDVPSGARAIRAFFGGPPPTLTRPQTPSDVRQLEAIAAAQVAAVLKGLPAPTPADKAAISTRTP